MADEPAKIILGDTAITGIEQPARRRFFRRKDRQRPPLIHCENCSALLTGRWCSQCGQAAIDYRRSFRHVIVDALDSFLNFESKFFATSPCALRASVATLSAHQHSLFLCCQLLGEIDSCRSQQTLR
jgi:hypothetical protein